MSPLLTNVGVSDVTRFQSDSPHSVVTAHVRLNFDEGGHDHQLGLAVDIQDATGMSFSDIEATAIKEAGRIIALAATLSVTDMEAMFRSQFTPTELATRS